MGFTPSYAVRAARDWLRQRQDVLKPACADPHPDVKSDHLRRFGPVGIRVFPPAYQTQATLITAVTEHQRKARRNPDYTVVAKVVPVPDREREGEKIQAPRLMRSLVMLGKNFTKIGIVDQKNECWHRYTCVKELAHVLTYGQGQVVDDVEKQLTLAFQIGNVLDWDAVVSREQFANIFAIEILLPFWHRECLNAQLDAEIDLLTIAQHFRVPRKVVDTYALTGYRAKSTAIIAQG